LSEGGTAQAPIRVLVIDDEAGVRRIFSRLLSRAEMDVTEACDGFEALAILEKQRFDVILSDITMPRSVGVALLEAVRQRDLATQVIYATGNPSLETAMRAVELGAMRYLTKPIDHRVLVETVREAARLCTGWLSLSSRRCRCSAVGTRWRRIESGSRPRFCGCWNTCSCTFSRWCH
jgi:DNA-binding NtrC family response regulator